MPKKAKYERVPSHHFAWRLSRRNGVWYADGRTNPINVGRHSLGARDKADALASLTVAVADGIVLGFAKTTAGHLDMLFVQPRAHGTGAGSALLAEAEARGVRTLECFRDNAAARGFYERRGWTLLRAYQRDFAGRVRDFVFYWKDGPPTVSE